MDLPTMRTKIRRDLHDEDAANYRWTNDEIDRHISHALLDISQAVPQQRESVGVLVIPTPAAKDIDITTLPGLMMVDAVEYPVGSDPREYRRFAVWGNTLTLLIDDTVTAGDAISVRYSAVHSLAQLAPAAWVADTAYALGDRVVPTVANGYQYECTTAGTSHAATEPTWPTVPGRTIIDATVVWTCLGGSTLPVHLEDLCAVGAGAYSGIEWASYAINQLNVGGEPTPTDYLKWAQDRMEFYQKELKRYGRQSRLKIARLYTD